MPYVGLLGETTHHTNDKLIIFTTIMLHSLLSN